MAASLPAGEVEFDVHAEHVLSAVAPVSFEYFPSAQLVQTVEEAAAAYLPASQSAQVLAPTTAENLPAVQSAHVEATLAPTTAENLPAVHDVHAVWLFRPVNVEYLPAPHKRATRTTRLERGPCWSSRARPGLAPLPPPPSSSTSGRSCSLSSDSRSPSVRGPSAADARFRVPALGIFCRGS